MNRTTRSVAAAALAAVVALGAVAPAVAAPPGGPGKPDKVAVKVDKQKPAKDRLERMANRKAGYLERLADSAKVARIDALVDHDLVTEIRTDAETIRGLTDPVQLRSARPVAYHRILNQIRLIVVNGLDLGLVDDVLAIELADAKPGLKAMQKTITGLLAEIEDEPELESELEDDPEAETTDESEESGEA